MLKIFTEKEIKNIIKHFNFEYVQSCMQKLNITWEEQIPSIIQLKEKAEELLITVIYSSQLEKKENTYIEYKQLRAQILDQELSLLFVLTDWYSY